MIRPNRKISGEQARRLLQRFRDLNLGPCGIDVSRSARVTVAGCLSVDHPVEGGVRYRVQEAEGEEQVLAIHWEEGQLVLRLRSRSDNRALVQEEIEVELGCDGLGRVAAPQLGARLHLDRTEPRDIEHFLRRIVRVMYTRAS